MVLTLIYNLVFSLMFSHAAFFYKDKEVQYPSGYEDSSRLTKNINSTEFYYRFQLKNRSGWLKEEDLIFKPQLFTHIATKEFTFTHKNADFSSAKTALDKGLYEVCKINMDWIHICKRGWLHRSVVLEYRNPGSMGYVVCVNDCRIYKNKNLQRPETSLNAGTKVLALKQEGNFLKITHNALPYYIETKDIIGHQNLKANDVITKLKPKIYEIQDREKVEWFQSYVKGHGNVWWQASKIQVASDTVIKTEEILKKKIFDIARSEKHQIKVISANGIYRSFDNEHWQKIAQFEDRNYPVYIDNEGNIYVGEYMSQNKGRSFKKYLHWANIVGQIPELRNKKLSINNVSVRENQIHLKVNVDQSFLLHIAKNKDSQNWQKSAFPKDLSLISYGL